MNKIETLNSKIKIPMWTYLPNEPNTYIQNVQQNETLSKIYVKSVHSLERWKKVYSSGCQVFRGPDRWFKLQRTKKHMNLASKQSNYRAKRIL